MKTNKVSTDFRIKPLTTHMYPFVVFSKNLLNPRKRKKRVGLAGFKNKAHNAGLNVRALNPLMMVEAAMVKANCL